ncbi:hypothetical protein KIW84_033316 [Lathyrus oleraceus]|uniref:F-box domain-containing protein n=1 Tax=Pisum sativum TaxID=3888 RepID=A0A9D4XWK9_PEA|nr:hypothetical protein KIW84_033316 [Pisum sativum]
MDSGGFVTARDRQDESECSKRQKCSQGEEDRISNLPDFIIGHILTFLCFKDAIRTSVLSQRMLLHLNASNINEFHLLLEEKYDPYIIGQLISLVSNKKIKVISLLSHNECSISCYPIFKCQSLEKLELAMGHSIIQFPSFVCLSSLTALYLVAIRSPMKITCYSSNQSKELTLKFPVLRDYISCDCIWLDVKRVTIDAPLLEKVIIERQWDYSSNVSHAEIEIRASYVTNYLYRSYVSSETTLLDAAHVAEASISLSDDSKVNMSGQELKIFVRKLFNINNLKGLILQV